MKKIYLFCFVICHLFLLGCTSDNDKSSDDKPTDDPNPPTINDGVIEQPNFLFIIADDLGVDVSSQYSYSSNVPPTPNLDELQKEGIVFDQFWVTPACTTSRGSLISGKHGFSSQISYVPAVMPDNTQSLQQSMKESFLPKAYETAVFGKWHLGGSTPIAGHPNTFGIDYYYGNLFNLDNYFHWTATTNGVQENSTEYHTSAVANEALYWISERPKDTPWFAWVAFSAPHVPFHAAPTDLVNIHTSPSGIQEQFFSMVEAMDTSIGKIIDGLSEEQKKNTIIVYLGDNGTPIPVMNNTVFDDNKGKNTVYEGGIRAPLIIAGEPVKDKNTRTSALTNITDFYSTLLSLANNKQPIPAGFVDPEQSYDFSDLIVDGQTSKTRRTYNYAEFIKSNALSWVVRNDTYKYIYHDTGVEELYNIISDIKETTNLIALPEYASLIAELKNKGLDLRSQASVAGTDITDQVFSLRSGDCNAYIGSYHANVNDINNSQPYTAVLDITSDSSSCTWTSNAIPNHDFNDGTQNFANAVEEVTETFNTTRSPAYAGSVTSLTLDYDDAIFLNGVKLDLLAAACYGIGTAPLGQEKVGCNVSSTPWRYDPVFSGNTFRTDNHNAHTQPDGAYHYHGDPESIYDLTGTTASGVIGFAADGYPIFGPYFDDGTTIRRAVSGHTLKVGARQSQSGEGAFPGGNYDGTYRDDYEFTSVGDLDECNGMTRDGVYGYYLTDGFPWVLSCFKGTPDPSFQK